ncbi:MAG: twin-arginine translocation signal domain-containing protein, partial [Lachnospiraceae bacterium]|nr:twin-arginine translocation signal domain-containing protein [Lachnospiraceae bacterium]
MSKITRREFLCGSAASVCVFALGMVPGVVLAQEAESGENGWTITSEGMIFDGSSRESFYISSDFIVNQNFRYTADVIFEQDAPGVAALVFQASEGGESCYAAMVDARTQRATLYKWENGLQIALGNDVILEDKLEYHLQINMIGTHIDFFVDNALICGTGDYVANQDYGQNDVYLSGYLGLFSGYKQVAFQNISYHIYEENESPALTELAISPQSGTVETEGNILANSWYVYQQYVSNDCEAVELNLQREEGCRSADFSPSTDED